MDRLTKKLDRPDIPVVYTKGWFGDTVPAAMNHEGIGAVLERLCDYEDTGFTPEQIMEMKKSANIKKCRRKGIVGIPKSGAKILFERVSERGIIIDSVLYSIPVLIQNHQGEKVKIRIVDNIATVFDLDTGEQIVWFELFLPNGVNCKHSFIPYTNDINMSDYGCTREEITKAKTFTQVVSRYGLQIDGKKYYLPDLVFSHLGYRVKIKIQGHMVDVYDFHNDKHLESFEL